jgi:hypothetical protein
VRDRRGAPVVAFGKKRHVNQGLAVAPIEPGRFRPGCGALAQQALGQPTLAQRLVDECVIQSLDRDGDSPLGREREALGMLPDRAQTASALIAGRDRLRVPGQRRDSLLFGEEAGDLAVGALGGAPLVEQVEPLLPTTPGPCPDRLVGGREHPLSGLRLLGREQRRPRRRVALTRLLHPPADETLK